MKKLSVEKLETTTGGGCGIDLGIAFVGMLGAAAIGGPAGLFLGGVWAYRFVTACK